MTGRSCVQRAAQAAKKQKRLAQREGRGGQLPGGVELREYYAALPDNDAEAPLSTRPSPRKTAAAAAAEAGGGRTTPRRGGPRDRPVRSSDAAHPEHDGSGAKGFTALTQADAHADAQGGEGGADGEADVWGPGAVVCRLPMAVTPYHAAATPVSSPAVAACHPAHACV